jgi:hypothetical protein
MTPTPRAGTFTHWLGWGLGPGAEGLGEGEAAPVEGRNDFGTSGYRGPCPLPGHGRHRYSFRLYALESDPDLPPGAGVGELERALDGHTRAVGRADRHLRALGVGVGVAGLYAGPSRRAPSGGFSAALELHATTNSGTSRTIPDLLISQMSWSNPSGPVPIGRCLPIDRLSRCTLRLSSRSPSPVANEHCERAHLLVVRCGIGPRRVLRFCNRADHGSAGGAGASRASSSATCSRAAATPGSRRSHGPSPAAPSAGCSRGQTANRCLPVTRPGDSPYTPETCDGTAQAVGGRAHLEEDVWHRAAANADATAVARPPG